MIYYIIMSMWDGWYCVAKTKSLNKVFIMSIVHRYYYSWNWRSNGRGDYYYSLSVIRTVDNIHLYQLNEPIHLLAESSVHYLNNVFPGTRRSHCIVSLRTLSNPPRSDEKVQYWNTRWKEQKQKLTHYNSLWRYCWIINGKVSPTTVKRY